MVPRHHIDLMCTCLFPKRVYFYIFLRILQYWVSQNFANYHCFWNLAFFMKCESLMNNYAISLFSSTPCAFIFLSLWIIITRYTLLKNLFGYVGSCWGPLMDRNLVAWSRPIRKRKRLIFLGLRRKPIKSLAWGLLCSRRPQVPSYGVKVQSTFSRRS